LTFLAAYFHSISFGLQYSLSKKKNIFGNLIKTLRYFWFRLIGNHCNHLTRILSAIAQFEAERALQLPTSLGQATS